MALPSRAVVPAPPDPILGLSEAARSDPRPWKLDLSLGVYVDESGGVPVMGSVLDAERQLAERRDSKAYLPIGGRPTYGAAIRDLLFGPGNRMARWSSSVTVQTPGGTGALRVAADFLAQSGANRTVWLSEPTWPNHPQLFRFAGFAVRGYPYLDDTGRRLDLDRLVGTLRTARRGDVVVLHGACHNPSGVDPDADAWRAIADVLEERALLPIVDLAYQGFSRGIREDADWADGLARPGLEFLVCSSCSKNFTLYNERVGALTLVATDAARATAALSHLKVAIRANYSNPPAHGADVVESVLGDPRLRDRWERELAAMRRRIQDNRSALVDALESAGLAGDWGPLRSQRGMFALLGLTSGQVARLRDEFAVYAVTGGRINVAGLTPAGFPRLVEALRAVTAD